MFWRRRLPHWVPDGSILFVTWRLAGCTYGKHTELRINIPQDGCRPSGPMWLDEPRIAQIVVEALFYGERVRNSYELVAWVLMGSHIHVAMRSIENLSSTMCWLKRATSVRANRILGRTGEFWAREYYDHCIRNQRELELIIQYIEWNPVRAGLVAKPEDWLWSSARP